MPCRSLPAPGSVIAMAVISSPLAEAGQPALLLLLGGEVAQVRPDDVVVQAEADAARADPGHLLVEDGVVAEVADPAAAELLLDVHAEQPLRAAGEPHLAGHDAVLLPLVVEGRDGLLGPAADHRRGTRRARPRRGSGACHRSLPEQLPGYRDPRRTVVPPWTLDDVSALDRFSEATRAWFTGAFVQPTPAQDGAWDAISSGEHALVVAPTGSGKTLAAFLWSLDRLAAAPPPADEQHRCRVLYVSPLKALAVDVERNLRAPLTGIGQAAARLGLAASRDPGGHPVRRHPRRRAPGDGPPAAGHPDHHARVAVPAADQLRPRGAARHRDGHRRRGARGRRHQARRPPRGLPRPARRAARTPGPADRPVGHRPPDRGGRHLPRRRPAGARSWRRRRRRSGTSRSSSRSRT